METGTWIAFAALLISLGGLILNSKKETKTEAATLAEIKTQLNTLNNGVDDIRVEFRAMQTLINSHTERLAKVEARAESNTHRLDTLEGKKKE